MAQYMLSVNHDAGDPDDIINRQPSDEDMQRLFGQVDAFNKEITAAGQWVFGGGLMPRESATCVDARGSVEAPIITDGPFSEAKEHLGGFWVLELPDLDAALKVAARASAACEGKVEVRPFQSE